MFLPEMSREDTCTTDFPQKYQSACPGIFSTQCPFPRLSSQEIRNPSLYFLVFIRPHYDMISLVQEAPTTRIRLCLKEKLRKRPVGTFGMLESFIVTWSTQGLEAEVSFI